MPDEARVPDIYIDGVAVLISPVDVTLNFSTRILEDGKQKNKDVGLVRMSLEHAKIMTMVLRRAIRKHEDEQGGEIVIHPSVYTNMGLSKAEDW